MQRRLSLAVIVLMLLCVLLPHAAARATGLIHHDLDVRLEPAAHTLAVRDRISFPAGTPREMTLLLDPGLPLEVEGRGASVVPSASAADGEAGPTRWRLTLEPSADTVTLVYRGAIDHPLEQVGEEYARGQRETPGTISDNGVFLSGAAPWYAQIEGVATFTSTLTVDLPEGWDAVSQGGRTLHETASGRRRVRWESAEPQDELYLVADRFTEYGARAGAVEAMVFLRSADEGLARQYLDATTGYLELYSRLIGPYPYGKWAAVENFWETGYGMPSFTLLGPKVIRFPFILHSSYPHEILHSWWGNGVFADVSRGNWSEGLAAYLADHLVKEQRGEGAEYRQTTLQKYADYALAGRDMPLTLFRSRHGSVTEAVGYGKSLMLFHMLRLQLGDQAFTAGLRALWEQRRFAAASFDDVQRAFEQASGAGLGWFFEQWVTRTGAPEIRLEEARATGPDGRDLTLKLAQMQPGEPYRMRLPVAVTIEGAAEAVVTAIETDGRSTETTLRGLAGRPLRVDVDPAFDIFRRLDRSETPAALSQAFGAEKALVLLPTGGSAELAAGYRALAAALERSGPGAVETREDGEIDELPGDRAVFLLGWENRFLPAMRAAVAGHDAAIAEAEVRLEGSVLPRVGHAFVITARHPGNADLTLSWAAIDDPAAADGLARKLPHYHKYSYLGFEGIEPANVAKGRWPLTDSPLSRPVAAAGGVAGPLPAMARLPKRAPLASLPPRFSSERMLEDVRALAAPELGGRGFGAPGLEQAAARIAAAFARAGLQPAGDAPGSWYQSFAARGGDPPRDATLQNVVGMIPGARSDLEKGILVIGAHYDHLGEGEPGSLPANRGRVHPGADDNASGVAILLELARTLWKDTPPARTVVFAAFAGEEAGRLGSAHFVAAPAFPPERTFAMVNLDTVGRLEGRKILVLGAASAPEWVHIFRGAGYLAGVETALAAGDLDASDDVTFRHAGVPAVQVFGGPSLDYHRPADTPDRIDAAGLEKVAALAAEVVGHLAGADARLSPAGATPGQPSRGGDGAVGERKVSLGVVPDFSFAGPGVRLEGVVPGSPAEKAGLKAGDVLLAIDGKDLPGLKALSALLKSLAPGRVELRYARDGVESASQATLTSR